VTATVAKSAGQSDEALLLDAALESIPYGFCVWSSAFRLVMWNRHYLDIYGFPRNRVRKGMTLDAAARLSAELGHHSDQSPAEFLAAYKAALLANRGGARVTLRERAAGGRTIETAHVYAAGLGWVVTHEDITEELAARDLLQKRRRELERQNIRLDAAVNNIGQGLCMFDARGRLVICNQPYARIYDLPEHLVRPGTRLDVILAELFRKGMTASTGEKDYIRWRKQVIVRGQHDKTMLQLGGRTILLQHHPMQDGGFVSTHEDVTEQHQQEERIRHMSRHDELTELPNRTKFIEDMSASEPAFERGEKAAVLCVDLDCFKAVNDGFGHAIGDRVLKQASARLWGSTRETDLLARVGGDEFALLLKPIERPADAAAIANARQDHGHPLHHRRPPDRHRRQRRHRHGPVDGESTTR